MSKSAHPASDKRDGNLAYIDMLRGVAILGVLLVHSTLFGMQVVGLKEMPMHIEWLLAAGRHGVTLFFVISAFTLMRSMHIRIAEEHMPMRKYFLRRFFRIAPSYYVVLLVIFLFFGKGIGGYTDPQSAMLTWPDLIAHMLFVNGFFPYYSNDFLGTEWSVSTEFSFYLLLPFIFLWLHKASSNLQATIKVVLLCLASIALYWLIAFKGQNLQLLGGGFAASLLDAWRYFFIATHLPAFLVGVAVWQVLSFETRRRFMVSADDRRTINKLALAGLLCVAIAGVYLLSMDNRLSDPTFAWFGLIFWAALSGALIYVLDLLKPTNAGVLRVLTGLGKVSFSLYLVHFPIIWYGLPYFHNIGQITDIPGINFLMFELVIFGLSYPLALLLFVVVEKPGMELGRALVKRLSTQRNVLVES
jgi:peptidoglycan/LPS O-acetylase OafA/YrhL